MTTVIKRRGANAGVDRVFAGGRKARKNQMLCDVKKFNQSRNYESECSADLQQVAAQKVFVN